MSPSPQMPELQGDTGLRKAISRMLQRYMQSEADPAATPAQLALGFAWWLFDHPEELEAAQVEAEGKKKKGLWGV
jgi:hypothetical protein